MKRFAGLLAAATLTLCAWSEDACAGKLNVENESGRSKVLKEAVATNDDESVSETEFPDLTLEAGEDADIQFDSITMPHLKKTVWEQKPGAGPMEQFQSIQFFEITSRSSWRYPVMYAEQANISYLIPDAALPQIDIPGLLVDAVVTTNGAGQDISGRFPPTVVFLDADTMLPFQGMLTSEGIVLWADQATAVPTVTEWGLIVLALLLAGGGAIIVRRRLAPAIGSSSRLLQNSVGG